jgi:hypothetical protein
VQKRSSPFRILTPFLLHSASLHTARPDGATSLLSVRRIALFSKLTE